MDLAAGGRDATVTADVGGEAMLRRYCYKCRQMTEHESGVNRFGNYEERCCACDHVNRMETQEWRCGQRRSERAMPLGATLRR